MAHTKSGGSTRLGRDSESKRLGVKANHDEPIKAGEIIIRQRGTRYLPGKNVARGADDTLYALKSGIVKFASTRKIRFDRSIRKAKIVSVTAAATK